MINYDFTLSVHDSRTNYKIDFKFFNFGYFVTSGYDSKHLF